MIPLNRPRPWIGRWDEATPHGHCVTNEVRLQQEPNMMAAAAAGEPAKIHTAGAVAAACVAGPNASSPKMTNESGAD